MKRIIVYCSLVVLVLLFGCSEKIFYKTIIKDGMPGDPLPIYSYYTIIELNTQGNKIGYLLPTNILHSVLYDNDNRDLDKRELWKELYKYDGMLYRDSSDIFIFPDTFKIINSAFQDSLSLLSTDSILDKYFLNKCELKKNILSASQCRSVIYTLVKRKEYVFTYMFFDNSGKIKQDVYYGRLIRNRDWVTKNRIKKKLLAK